MRSATAPPPQETIASILGDCPGLTGPLDAERYASILCGNWDRGPAAVPQGRSLAFRDALVPGLTCSGCPNAVGLLRALSCVAAPPVGPAAASAAARLERRGVVAPPWAPSPGAVVVSGAARWWDPAGDGSVVLLIEFAAADSQRHTIVGFVNGALYGGMATRLGVVRDLDDIEAIVAEGKMRFLRIAPPAAATELRAAMDLTDSCRETSETTAATDPSYFDDRAFVIARLNLVTAQTPTNPLPAR